jgi:hypothetical protein
MPIVWGVRTSQIIITLLLGCTAILVGYINFLVLPFPHDWQTFSTRYAVFGLIVPIICAIILMWAAKNQLELHRAQLITKFVMFMGTMYSFVIHQNLLIF